MKINEPIRQSVSQILGTMIPKARWQQYIDLLDRDGKFTRKNMLSIAIMSCQQIELLEDIVDDLSNRLNLLEGNPKTTSKTAQMSKVKLRTLIDVLRDLDLSKQEEDKAYFASPLDFSIMEKNIDSTLAKNKPEYGYGKEFNPLTQREEVCLYHRDLPVFRVPLTNRDV